MLFAAKLPVFVEVALDLPRGALGFQIAPRRGEGQESLVIAEQDSLAAFEFALRRYAAGKPFQAARYGFLAALDNLGHAILTGISDICLKRPNTELGRASCRERGGQYVWITVVG